MYESFYGLKEKPFSLLPDPAFLYLSRQHEMAITLLEYSLENQAGFCVITGKAGTGKTTLLRRLLNQIGDDVSIGLITNTHHSFGELLRWILHAFSLDDSANNRARQHQIFVDYLIAQYAKNRRTMLIIDEAQNMSAEALEELRMLSNINSEKDLLLQVILVGQPPLREVLRRPELEQFAQRVAVDYHLDSLSSEETRGYIRHRLRVAGGEHELFTDDACEAVFVHSSGIPRLINLLCDLALVYAYAAQAAVVTGELIEQIVSEREKHGALPIFAASQESRVAQRPLLKHAQSSAAAGMSETVSTRAVRHAAARRLGGDVKHVTVAEQKSAVSPERPDVSGKDRAHVVKRARVEEIQKPLATPRAATVVQDAQAMFALDASPDGRTVQEAAPAPVTDVQAGKNIVSVAPVVTEMVLHNGVASEVSPEVNKLGVTDNSHRHSPDRPRDSKLVDARPVKDRKPGSMGMALRRGVTDRFVLARRYVPAMIMILMMFAAVLAWLSLGQPNLTMAFSGQASPARVAAAIPAAERKPVASEPTSALPSANQSVPGTLPMQQAVAESHMAGKKAAEEARLKQIQRERDAALAIAAAAARERETLRNAALARERVLATEHEAVLARERERAKQLTQAVEMAILQAHDAEMAAEAKAAEPVMPTPTMKAEAAPVIKVVGGDLSPQKAGVEDATKTGVSETTTFAANPCKGPSARFLSTCE